MFFSTYNLQPGQIYEEGCRKCQCIDNSLTCHEELCETETPVQITQTTIATPITMPPIVKPPKTTPPPKCDEDRSVIILCLVNI